MTRPIIIDTDPGIDDAMAILYALASPELEVVGITTVFGNASVDGCTLNALRILDAAGRSEIPVAAGADRPLLALSMEPAAHVHGRDGLGDVEHPPLGQQAIAQSAVDFLVERLSAGGEPLTLVTLGPLTNIAQALQRDPALAPRIREIVVMGGNAFVSGNISPAAEANVYKDPEAADIVFGADCPITMVGLDVTNQVTMTAEALRTLQHIPNSKARFLARIVPCYQAYHVERYGLDGILVHDSTTITYLLRPDLFETVQHPIRVEKTGLGQGKTWPALGDSDLERAWRGRPPINICVDVDAEQAIALELDRLRM